MLQKIEEVVQKFLKESENRPVRVISHFDTDGITSASILTKTLSRLDKKFSVRIVKGLDETNLAEELKRNETEVLLFSDLASGSMAYFKNLKNPIFILDHHELDAASVPENVHIINPHLTDNQVDNDCTGAGVCYLFAKTIDPDNQDLAKLAMIGLIGDRQEGNLSKINQVIIQDTKDLTLKKGLVLYPATRPLRRALEYSTSPYIPGVTGNPEGVMELLRETGISYDKSLLDLDEIEMGKLVTAVMIRRANQQGSDEALGNLFILKFFNRKEDIREISVLINACSRLGYSDVALSYCLQNEKAKMRALDIYNEYKQELVSGLRVAEKMEKINGKGFVILNAKDQIKDAIVGTVCSMLSSSPTYEEGTILIGMAYNEDKIKVSARMVGREGRNLKEVLERTVTTFKSENPEATAEVGGHKFAAGCLVEKSRETHFIESLKKNLEIEVVKI